MKLPLLKLSLCLFLIAGSTNGELNCEPDDYISPERYICKPTEDGMIITKESIKKISDASRNTTNWQFSRNSGEAGIISIEDGSFSDLPIVYLDMSDNSLTAISSGMLGGLPNLQRLDLSENKIVDVAEDAFVDKKQLKFIDLEKNNLKKFPGSSFKILNLESISIDHNSIAALTREDLSPHEDLAILTLSYNKLTYLPEDVFEDNTQLTLLLLNGNSLQTLQKKTFSKLTKLSTLRLDYNSIKILPAEIFSDNSNLNWIHLQNNKLSILPSELFSKNTKLRHVYLEDNELTEIPEDFFKNTPLIEAITLQENQLTTLPFIGNLNDLDHYNLSSNYINYLPEDFFEKVIVGSDTKSYFLRNNPLDCHCLKNILKKLPARVEVDIGMDDLSKGDECICTTSDPQIDCKDSSRTLTAEQKKKFSQKCF